MTHGSMMSDAVLLTIIFRGHNRYMVLNGRSPKPLNLQVVSYHQLTANVGICARCCAGNYFRINIKALNNSIQNARAEQRNVAFGSDNFYLPVVCFHQISCN